MFVISIIFLLFFGILFSIDPSFLKKEGYEWFPYRLWYTEKPLFRFLGIMLMIASVVVCYVLFKFNEKLFQVQKMIEYSIHFSSRNLPILAVSFALITVMKFSILGAALRIFDIMQSSKPVIDPKDCKKIVTQTFA
jgi:hypothetical protein